MSRGRRHDERGAVAVFLAVTVSLLVIVGAFAVDLGMQRVVRRDMQALADVVALDLARELDGRSQSQLAPALDRSSSASALSRSLAGNQSTLGDNLVVEAVWGAWNGSTFDATADPPTAVRVSASADVGFSFTSGRGAATRSAVASTIRAACFALGSFSARFRSSDSALLGTLVGPLNELLRPQASLSVADYSGLATARATLEELAVAAGAVSPQHFLTAGVTAQDLMAAAISLLQKEDPVNTVAISALERLAQGKAALTTPVLLTDVVSMAPSDAAALQTDVNILDLVAGTILVADGVNGFKLGNGNLGTKIGGVASLTSASLSVIERPKTACGAPGGPGARTSQVRGSAEAKLELPTINLGGGDIVQTAPATVLLAVDLGNAEGTLASEPTCGAGTAADPDRMSVDVQSGLATFALTSSLGFRTTLNISGIGQVEVTWQQAASATRLMPDRWSQAALSIPPHDTTPVTTGEGDPTLDGVTVAKVATDVVATTKVLGVSVGVDLALVEPLLQPIVSALAVHATVDGRLDTLAASIDSYLTPLLTLLGINVAGADVFAVGRPICAAPVLRG